MSQYLKVIMAVLSTVVTGLSVYYGQDAWYPIVTSAIGALTVYLVPNTPKTPTVRVMDINSAYPKDVHDSWIGESK